MPMGTCYPDAVKIARRLGDPAVVVHGVVWQPAKRRWIHHAWVEHSGKIYDTVFPAGIAAAKYRKLLKPKLTKRYSVEQALIQMLRNQHWGPWDGALGAPDRWWMRKPPKNKACFKHKSDALRVFLDHNMSFIDRYAAGETYQHGCSEFDSINSKYDIPRSRCARTVVDAVWYALKGRGQGGGPPYCIKDIDLKALNETTAGSQGGGFELPPTVQEEVLDEDTERYWRDLAVQAGRSDCFITWRQKHGYFTPERPGAKKRALLCVCRVRGRFARCPEAVEEEVPF